MFDWDAEYASIVKFYAELAISAQVGGITLETWFGKRC